MSDNSVIKIRPMNINDLGRAMELSCSEGWNQTGRDWKLLLENSINTCIVAEFNGNVIGTATALNHSNKVAWIGMVIVDKRIRGQGVGKMLLADIIDALKSIDSIKLDATPAGLPLYKKLGFKEEFLIYRMINSSTVNAGRSDSDYEPVSIDHTSLPEVLEADRVLFGTDRSYLLRTLFESYPEKAFIIRDSNKLSGYIFGRDGIRYNYIGPLFAFSSDAARSLFTKALQSLSGKPVALDVLEDKADFTAWLESAGFLKQRHFIRMFLKNNSYPGEVKYQFLISGPEFG